ncbi:hypothetical protein OGAPHI_001469 [Ogataea philodendri]|uniref:Uncharacterized protein n=1 Tax=Ogataea philodendri TaxID=1378263 RepID=A0A9P8T7M6_9ASCO|nr:uncharacterized protein OGAPHI_001469 [Ogataea philodendri]KAH3669348.1 hypothetical protein OGAPHI_001469 [Ogataea philodendri]
MSDNASENNHPVVRTGSHGNGSDLGTVSPLTEESHGKSLNPHGRQDVGGERWFKAEISISSSTSAISSPIPASLDIDSPSRRRLIPNTMNSTPAKNWVNLCGIRAGNAWPTTPESTVISTRAANAAENTTALGCFIAMSAATRNVLSPISLTTIMDVDIRNASDSSRGASKSATGPELSFAASAFRLLRWCSKVFSSSLASIDWMVTRSSLSMLLSAATGG